MIKRMYQELLSIDTFNKTRINLSFVFRIKADIIYNKIDIVKALFLFGFSTILFTFGALAGQPKTEMLTLLSITTCFLQ